MNSKQAAAQRELARRELARRSLTDYCCYVDPKAGWGDDPFLTNHYRATHLVHVAQQLEALERGDIKRMMLFMPNRHWKSSLCTMKFVSWFVGRRYTADKPHQVMLISHTGDKAEEFSEYSRNLIRDTDGSGHSLYRNVFPGVHFSNTRQGAAEWGLRQRQAIHLEEPFPTLTAGSMSAPPTGSGADLLIIDDPIKSSRDARSASTQQMHFKTWQEGLRTRLNDPNAAVLLTLTRWHINDIAGQLLRLMQSDPLADQWHVVILPALAYTSKERQSARRLGIPVPDTDPIGREPGEALWPSRFSRQFHLATKANSESSFASIGQQTPVAESGDLIGRESFKYLETPPRPNRQLNPRERIQWVISIDAAYKEKQLAKDDPDYNVFGLLGFWMPEGIPLNVNIVLANLVRTQQGMTAAQEIGWRYALAMEQLLGTRPPIIAAQASLDKVLLDHLRGNANLMNWRIRSLDDPLIKRTVGAFTGDKVAKFEPWRDRAIGGRFYLVDEAWSIAALREAFPPSVYARLFGTEPLAWHEKFFAEVEAFPDWPHDDMVDMVSGGYHTFSLKPEKRKAARSYQG